MATAGTARIVVGVDGSEASAEALEWAARYAEATGARIEAVTAWHFPTSYGVVPDLGEVDLEGDARVVLDKTVAEVRGRHPGVAVDALLANGHPSQVLLDAAKDASLLVVGSRGHGGFAGMLVGSVSNFCVHHAPCPIVVVRRPKVAA